jgi:hypothetical protein
LPGSPWPASRSTSRPAVVLAISGILALAALMRRRPRPESPDRAIVLVTLGFVAVTAAFPAASEWWRIYSDNWTHAGIVRAVVRGVPPLDPGFAGAHLQYAWIYHAFVAGVHVLTGVDVYAYMLVLCSAALAATLLAAGSTVPRGRVWSLLLLGLGLNALFPLFLPLVAARALTGEVRGMAELSRQFDLRPLQWESTGVFLRSLSGQTFFLDKFMVVTPFALSLAAFVAWSASLRRWLDGGARGELGLAAALALAAGLMHPVTGVFIASSCGLGAMLMILVAAPIAGAWRPGRWRPSWGQCRSFSTRGASSAAPAGRMRSCRSTSRRSSCWATSRASRSESCLPGGRSFAIGVPAAPRARSVHGSSPAVRSRWSAACRARRRSSPSTSSPTWCGSRSRSPQARRSRNS